MASDPVQSITDARRPVEAKRAEPEERESAEREEELVQEEIEARRAARREIGQGENIDLEI